MTISDEEFERNVEAAVSAIAERNKESDMQLPSQAEKSAPTEPQGTARNSLEGEYSHRRKDTTQPASNEDSAAVTGLLRTIQKPLSTIGRIFSDEGEPQRELAAAPSQQATTPRRSPTALESPRNSGEERSAPEGQRSREAIPPQQSTKFGAQEAAARQASAEAAEARRIQRAEHDYVVE